jgi:outer membrane protein OmpA-like peptidoglycan-associated protein
MVIRRVLPVALFLVTLATLIRVAPVLAQDGKLKIHVVPKQAYVFVDGRAMGDKPRTLNLSAGEHKVSIYNYGFKPAEHTVTITASQVTPLDVTLEPIAGTLNGPWGCITLEGVNRAAVLLNGKTPDYFVGHGDEFNHEWIWKQELIVPPGTHELTVMKDTRTIWSGPVNVPANQRVVIDADKGGIRKTVPWPRGEQLGARPRFTAGTASAAVVIAPVTTQFAATPTEVGCGASSKLTWSTSGAVRNEITDVGAVALSGEQTVQPKQTTTYKLTSSGPGGVATPAVTVNVNPTIQASLNVSPAEVRYRRIGDQVTDQGSATLTWSASGADSVSLDQLGSVDASGNRTVQPTPKKTDPGPVNETVTYTIRAANACGGSEVRTASLRLVGEIAPVMDSAVETELQTKLAMNSVYFPTALPTPGAPKKGLVPSQQKVLTALAGDFMKYQHFQPKANLIIQAHADSRGSIDYNRALSERRAERVKSFLIEQGVPASNIELKAFGKEDNLDADAVKQLEEQNPNVSAAERQKVLRNLPTTVLANNRRVDVVLSTTGQTSLRYFPHNAEDAADLMGASVKTAKSAKKVEKK